MPDFTIAKRNLTNLNVTFIVQSRAVKVATNDNQALFTFWNGILHVTTFDDHIECVLNDEIHFVVDGNEIDTELYSVNERGSIDLKTYNLCINMFSRQIFRPIH